MKLVVIGSLFVAAAIAVSMVRGDNKSVVKYPNDKIVDSYQNTVRTFLLDQPTDGKFGNARVPSVHDLFAKKIPGYQDIRTASLNYRVYSFLIGSPGGKTRNGVGFVAKLDAEALRTVCFMRIYDEKDLEDPTQGGLFFGQSRFPTDSAEKKKDLREIANDLSPLVKSVRETAMKKNYETYSKEIKVNGSQSWVAAKAVTPTDKSCYNCHTGVKYGQPIGHIVTFLISK